MSVLDANMCLLDASEGQILFLNLVCCSMSFYWEIDTTGVRVINEQCFLIPAILLLGCGFFPSTFDLMVQDYLFLVFSWVLLTSSSWIFHSWAFCRTRYVERYYLNLVFHPTFFFLHLLWLKVLQGIIVWSDPCEILEVLGLSFGPFYLLGSPLKVIYWSTSVYVICCFSTWNL